VTGSRHKEDAHIFASDEEFFEFGQSDDLRSTTQERLEWVMSQSHQKQTATQVMESHGYSISDVLEGRITTDELGEDMSAEQQSGISDDLTDDLDDGITQGGGTKK